MFLDYRINLYFNDHNLAIESDENGHSERNIDYKIKIQKGIERKLSCNFIRIDPDKEYLDVSKGYE